MLGVFKYMESLVVVSGQCIHKDCTSLLLSINAIEFQKDSKKVKRVGLFKKKNDFKLTFYRMPAFILNQPAQEVQTIMDTLIDTHVHTQGDQQAFKIFVEMLNIDQIRFDRILLQK